jgi:hypothetical protein
MRKETPIERRRREINRSRVEAHRLLAVFNHESMKDLVRRALQDLDEADIWLLETNLDARPPILEIVDFNIRISETRLAQLASWLSRYGPGADTIN